MLPTIHIAHSPDSDDAFMFYGLSSGKVDAPGLEYQLILKDIESLNQDAFLGRYEITALSIHAYAYLADRYTLLASGASMGEGYGPIVVSQRNLSTKELLQGPIALPGKLTSATLALKLAIGPCEPLFMPFDQIIPAVQGGKVAAGLLIHEGQLTCERDGLVKILDLGQWWHEKTGLPLPLGGNAVRKDLGPEMMTRLAHLQRTSIEYGLAHRAEALNFSQQYARGLNPHETDRFIGMYVNARSLDYGEDGKEAVRLFLRLGFEAGLLPRLVTPEFAAE